MNNSELALFNIDGNITLMSREDYLSFLESIAED
jgi:hypothetical protein